MTVLDSITDDVSPFTYPSPPAGKVPAAVTTVAVRSSDTMTKLGAESILGAHGRVRVLTEGDDLASADVIVVLEQSIGHEVLTFLREVHALSELESPRCVIVTSYVQPAVLMTAIECGVVAMLRRDETGGAELIRTVLTVDRGEAHLPSWVQGQLLQHLDRARRDMLEPSGLTLFGPSERERDVLRLLADGYSTEEIAAKLAYSAGTVKNVVNAVMARHGLRNRAHAVAYAVRTAAI